MSSNYPLVPERYGGWQKMRVFFSVRLYVAVYEFLGDIGENTWDFHDTALLAQHC